MNFGWFWNRRVSLYLSLISWFFFYFIIIPKNWWHLMSLNKDFSKPVLTKLFWSIVPKFPNISRLILHSFYFEVRSLEVLHSQCLKYLFHQFWPDPPHHYPQWPWLRPCLQKTAHFSSHPRLKLSATGCHSVLYGISCTVIFSACCLSARAISQLQHTL